MSYLHNHAIAGPGVLRKYALGYVAEPLPGDERFAGRLTIPYLTRSGPRALKFRATDSGARPKYGQHSGQRVRLFNTEAYFAASEVIGLCEGEVDAIAATEHLGVPTMGIPGADAWTKYGARWAPIFSDFPTVLVFADGDEPGQRLAGAVADTLGWRARIIHCPEGEDVASLVAAGKAEWLRGKCTGAVGVNT